MKTLGPTPGAMDDGRFQCRRIKRVKSMLGVKLAGRVDDDARCWPVWRCRTTPALGNVGSSCVSRPQTRQQITDVEFGRRWQGDAIMARRVQATCWGRDRSIF